MKGTFKKYDEKKEKLIILICLKWKVLMFSMLFNLWSRFLFSFLIRLDYYHHLYYLLFAMSQDKLLDVIWLFIKVIKRINLVVGDQADKTTVDDWVVTAGGNFNVIVDDGVALYRIICTCTLCTYTYTRYMAYRTLDLCIHVAVYTDP